jgi:hypothetical protein
MIAIVLLESTAKLLAAGMLAVYLGLVLMSYRLDGSGQTLRVSWRDPVRGLVRLCVWVGVKALVSIISIGRSLFTILTETSADVGEEYIRRRPHSALAAFRSHFI